MVKLTIDIKKQYDYITYQTSLTHKRINGFFKNNYFSLIKEILIENESETNYEDLVLNFTFSNNIIKINPINIDFLNSKQKVIVDTIEPIINVEDLYRLSEPFDISLEVTLNNKNNEIIAKNNFVISLYPYILSVTPYDNPGLFASFVTPNDYLVNKITLEAINELSLINNNKMFLGYQNGDINAIRAEMMAIFNALYNYKIAYSNPPASFETFQKIRIPQTVLELHKGTCIDLAILYAACLENIGLHPLLIIKNGHAYAGAFLNEIDKFNEIVCESNSLIYNLASDGMNKICLVECTYFTIDKYADFNSAIKFAKEETLKDSKYFKAIDIYSAHSSYFKPIPTFNEKQELDFKVKLNGKNEDLELIDTKDNGKLITIKASKNDKFSYWEKKLLDLSLTNKLINLKFNNSSLQVMNYSSNDLLKFLINNENIKITFKEYKDKDKATLYYSFNNEDFKRIIDGDYLQKTITLIANEKDYKKIIKKANDTIEETGSNTLYLTLGLIRFNVPKSKKYNFAPIILIPLHAKSKKINGKYDVEVNIDEAIINTTLLEYFKVNYKISFDEIYDVCDDMEKLNFVTLFNTIKSKSNNDLSIVIDENVSFISNFTFNNYILWDDIKNRKDELMQNKIIKALVDGVNFVNKKEEDIKLDEYSPSELAIPLSADSSQIKAIIDATNGESFILDGPPGTGKSQTIVNMIVNALYHHKTVLFVAEKMAALNVVYKRIKEIGLSKFTLELHSNKATKSSVLNQLNEAFEFETSESPKEFKEISEKLLEKRKSLNKIINKLHENKNNFLSLYDSILLYEDNKEFSDVIEINPTFFNKINHTLDEEVKEELRKLNLIYKNKGKFTLNPFYLYDSIDFNIIHKNELIDDLNKILNNLIKLNEAFNDLKNSLSFDIYYNRENIILIKDLLTLIFENDLVFSLVLKDEMINKNETNLEIFKCVNDVNNIKNKYLKYFINEASNINIDVSKFNELNEKEKKKFYKNAKKILRKNLVNRKSLKIKQDNYFDILTSIRVYREKYNFVLKTSQNLIKFLNIDSNLLFSDYEKYFNLYLNSIKFSSLFNFLNLSMNKGIAIYTKLKNIYENKDEKIHYFFNAFNNLFNELLENENNLKIKYGYNVNYLNIQSASFFSDYIELINKELNAINDFEDVVLINQILEKLRDLSFSNNFIKLYKLGKLDENHLLNYYQASLTKELIKNYFVDQDFALFNGIIFNDVIDQYRYILKEYSHLVIEETASRISQNFPNNSIEYAQSTKVYQLKKLIKNGGYKTSIRKMLLELDDLIRTLCPCFLMSPLSAAQYLSVHAKKFDIVIFDEASQIPTFEAIGAISRGNNLVVAGDPLQLPPTNFFVANNDKNDEDDNETSISENYEDLESLLDDCIALNLKRNRLLWHYRSHHESLITFSNNHYYNNDLYTFPSPDNENSKVHLEYLPYGKNEHGVNKEEAYAILKEVKRRFEDPSLNKKSIGIITSNIKQQEFILDLINDYLDTHPSINAINETNEEKLFVKNLENVQGDERDVILFSVGFSKNKYGKLNLFFGPLSLEKGERRLNVAITRAREEMIIFSSIKASDIDSYRAKNNGADELKAFLSFAEHGKETLIPNNLNQIKHHLGIEKDIQYELKKRGISSDLAIGDSKFRVDLGIKDQQNNYILGIICDSESYYEAPTCRDRNVIQVAMMNNLKWKIYRVWTIEYYKNPKKIIDEIINVLNNINNYNFKDDSLNIEQINVNFKKSNKRIIDNSEPYVRIFKNLYHNYNSYYKDRLYAHNELIDYLDEVIRVEGPISLELIKERFKDAIQIKKWGNNVEKLFNANFKQAKMKRTFSLNKEFYWPIDTTDFTLKKYRRSNYEIRSLDNIPIEEYIVAINDILYLQNDLSLNDAIRILANKFGYQKLNDQVIPLLKQVYLEVVRLRENLITIYINENDGIEHVKINY